MIVFWMMPDAPPVKAMAAMGINGEYSI